MKLFFGTMRRGAIVHKPYAFVIWLILKYWNELISEHFHALCRINSLLKKKKKKGPTMPQIKSAYQTFSCSGCRVFSIMKWGFSVSQMRQFYLFTYPSRWKWISSLHQSIQTSNWSLSIISMIEFANSKHCSFDGWLSCWWIWILYGNSCR